MPGPILILIEGKDEQIPVNKGLRAKRLSGNHRPYKAVTADGTELIVAVTGVGPERARKVTEETIELYKPSLVVSAGTVGALTPALECEDWLITTECRYLGERRDGGREQLEALQSPVPAEIVDTFVKALTGGGSAPKRHDGVLVSVKGAPIIERAEKDAIVAAHEGVVAVDMETFGIAKASTDAGIPWLVARVVVDTPDIPLPEFGGLNVVTGRPGYFALLLYVLGSPIAGPRNLWRLWDLVTVYAHDLVRALPDLKVPGEPVSA